MSDRSFLVWTERRGSEVYAKNRGLIFHSTDRTSEVNYRFIHEPTARSAVPGVSPGRGLLIPLGRKRSQKSINNRGRMGVMGDHLTDLKNTANNGVLGF